MTSEQKAFVLLLNTSASRHKGIPTVKKNQLTEGLVMVLTTGSLILLQCQKMLILKGTRMV